ncbi:MAG: DUF1192 domain-containing protein [Alphaproteobacteria bacterium]|nr:DUF1192 domain-containing protein [Alphaproteobacteria bacterium]
MFDDDLPKAKKTEDFPRNLELLSVSDLENYIEELESEISRVRQDIEKKNASRNAADSFFK